MHKSLAAMLTALTLLVAPAMGQQPNPAPKADPARIAGLIESLDSPVYVERERATRELIALQEAALEPLHKVQTAGRNLELVCRVRKILDDLAIYEPGGEIVSGLKLRLTADRDRVKPGDPVTLTTTLCNMTGKPLNVLLGHTTCGNYLECGAALRRAQAVPGRPTAEFEPKCQVGFCGTGAGPIYLTVPAKSVARFTMQATLDPQRTGYALGKDKYFVLDSTRGADALVIVLSVAPGHPPRPANPGQKGAGIRPTDEDAPFWSGIVRSNEVRLQTAE